MSITCIVCLGDLEDEPRNAGPISGVDPTTTSDTAGASDQNSDAEMVAHLLPCGHDLHNDCLKPWVERANSCPICRQSFNSVRLSVTVGGPEVSSYSVEDRIQVAELDPSVIVDDIIADDLDSQPCVVCGNEEHPELLLLCEGCDLGFHVYCVGLDSVPADEYWCENCSPHRALGPQGSGRDLPRRPQTVPEGSYFQRQGRHLRSLRAAHFYHWESVWQSVWENLDLDLDNPSEDEEGLSQYRRSHRSRAMRSLSRQAAWEARQDVAEEQGGSEARFEDTRPALLNRFARRQKSESPPPITQDELRAWDAYEKAKEAETTKTGKRKRKSTTTSPAEPEASQPAERKLKRPNTKNTRRVQELGEPSSDNPNRPVGASKHPGNESSNGEPSFLQSLLRKVEDEGSTPSKGVPPRYRTGSISTAGLPTDHFSPASSSSPGSSPTTSNYSSPRAMSTTPPPPPPANRPMSPLSLTSKVEPVFPQRSFSPSSSSLPTTPSSRAAKAKSKSRSHEGSRSRPRTRTASHHGSSNSPESSPERARKADIQKMVKSALSPYYHNQGMAKDDYTNINRNISRMLYREIGDVDVLEDKAREFWEKFAVDEVAKAVGETKKSP
ncbi:MAG: hypothetical protein M1837_005014 [Sclerophora amabilis]|nr:MAG: hypothetical protein M1837_005014 [Sclerophora amabilis]